MRLPLLRSRSKCSCHYSRGRPKLSGQQTVRLCEVSSWKSPRRRCYSQCHHRLRVLPPMQGPRVRVYRPRSRLCRNRSMRQVSSLNEDRTLPQAFLYCPVLSIDGVTQGIGEQSDWIACGKLLRSGGNSGIICHPSRLPSRPRPAVHLVASRAFASQIV